MRGFTFSHQLFYTFVPAALLLLFIRPAVSTIVVGAIISIAWLIVPRRAVRVIKSTLIDCWAWMRVEPLLPEVQAA